MKPESKHEKIPTSQNLAQPRPRWLRWLLMAILIAICAIGFYHTNAVTFDRIINR